MAGTTERRQVLTYDRIVKTRAWSSLLLVHPKGDLEVNGLLAFCPRLRITLVWDPEFIPPRAAPTERARRTAVLARLRVTSRANPRLYVRTGPPLEIASELHQEQLAGDLEPFSGAVLAQLDDDKPLYPQLKAWAGLVAPGGLLIGKQHGNITMRAELTRAAPKWRPWPSGLWLIDVDGLRLNGASTVPAEASALQRRTVLDQPVSPIAGVEVPLVLPSQGDDAVQLMPPLDVSRETAPALNLRRTRPVWDTLEANLGL